MLKDELRDKLSDRLKYLKIYSFAKAIFFSNKKIDGTSNLNIKQKKMNETNPETALNVIIRSIYKFAIVPKTIKNIKTNIIKGREI